jgi:regulator of nonsense transcripts 1
LSHLLAAGDVDDRNIVVISPYSKQVQLIRTELVIQRNTQNVRVGTVDSFQGQETDVVVFSAVRSNPTKELGFLRDSRRLCVAITRARRGLILVGDKRTLKSCHHWAALIDYCDKRGCFVEIHDVEQTTQFLLPVLPIEPRAPVEDAIADLFDEAEDVFGLFSSATSNLKGL